MVKVILIDKHFFTEHANDHITQLWTVLLHHKASFIAHIGQKANVEQYRYLCAMDKLTLTLLLWKTGCTTIEELKLESHESELKQATLKLLNELWVIGVPLSTMRFLLTKGKITMHLDFTSHLLH